MSDQYEDISENIGRSEAVKQEVQESVIEKDRAISMKVIHKLYDDGHAGDTRYRNKLKQRIISEFPDLLYFFKIDGKSPEVIVSKEGINSTAIANEKFTVLRQAAKFIREDILQSSENNNEHNWPRSIEEL